MTVIPNPPVETTTLSPLGEAVRRRARLRLSR